MKLRSKVSLIILLVWGLLLATTYFEGKRLLTQSYLQLEHQNGMNNIIEVKETIDRMLSELSKMDAFWSIFDDAYQFMADKNQEYINGTATVSTLGQADIDVMLYFTPTGQYFYGLAVDPTREKIIPLPEGLSDYLQPKGKLVYQPHVNSSFQGFVSIPSGILLVASHSIVKSDSTGPSRGAQILAKRFTNETLKKIADTTHLDLTMYRINATSNINELKNGPLVKVGKNKKILYGYLLLRDINDQPIAIIQAAMPRDIYQSGINTMYYFNYVFFGFGVVFVFVLSYLLRSLLISRLEKLNKNIIDIGSKKQFSLRVNEEGSDELTSVEKETNKMLSAIEKYSEEQKILLKKVSDELDNVNKFSKKLQETESLLSDTINFMPSMLVIINADLTISHLNSLAEKYIEKPVTEVTGKSLFEFFPYIKNYEELLKTSFQNKTINSIDKIACPIQDKILYFSVVIYPLSHPEKGRGLALRIDNISEKVKLEDELRQTDKLSSIGILTAGIANEIVNPISFIESILPTISSNISELINTLNKYAAITSNDQWDEIKKLHGKVNNIDYDIEKTNRLLDEIKSAANQTDEIVRNLKTFVRLDENLEKNYDIKEGIDSAVNLLKYKCINRIDITKEYTHSSEINCIPGKLNQVFMNIISNAIDAIPHQGAIKIKTTEDERDVSISIKDNGTGISKEHQSKIFQPFFSTKKAESGSGLGLSISFSVIKELHGDIQFKSEAGKGTEFIITLPRGKLP
ncbi:MAG: GHKL domain-containing protein [Gammaproteobacteria bacterium]|nr:MAG: GHKL domain-containing protein [Gammaproteobacteria bacterium]